MHFQHSRWLLKFTRSTGLEFPRELHQKRQVAVLVGCVVLVLSCIMDFSLAAMHRVAYYRTEYDAFRMIGTMAVVSA